MQEVTTRPVRVLAWQVPTTMDVNKMWDVIPGSLRGWFTVARPAGSTAVLEFASSLEYLGQARAGEWVITILVPGVEIPVLFALPDAAYRVLFAPPAPLPASNDDEEVLVQPKMGGLAEDMLRMLQTYGQPFGQFVMTDKQGKRASAVIITDGAEATESMLDAMADVVDGWKPEVPEVPEVQEG